ncbi:acetyl-CoA acetyltransferase [Tamaricihabitans halophyticus]|uniref:Acetyl-CoA acetyltransferase n=1 Tax=Tamaricihabitans halophyticus TaxID=1262583 RepID=A0A4R2QDV6_9PSEU|nr:acetyl-CoA acetyltransferase [Tamaricihabitans halophyticus]TCP46819.1 acetyl-CoA acetyltransferase [Tamaricihabitans halophyticus]
MTGRRRAAIAGVAESELGKTPHLTVLAQQVQASRAALAEAGLGRDDVDALFVAGNWSWSPAVALAEYLGIRPDYLDSTNIGGSSFEAHIGHAAAAIEAGMIDVALITYGSTQRSDRSRNQPRPATLTEQYDRPFGLPLPVGAYALAAARYQHEYGVSGAQLAEVAVSTRKWAQLNPVALHRDPLTVDEVLASPMICEPLHKLDCCLVTDGGGAVVLVAEDRWADLATRPVQVLGHGETTTHSTITNMPDLTVTGAARSGPRAMRAAGIDFADIDVLEIYDSFTITVLLTLESLGFCKPGEAADLFTEGHAAPGGRTPINTNGGGLSYTHPGMYGIFLLIEATRQLRHDYAATDPRRQVTDAEVALVHGTGGVLSSTSTVLLGRS